MLNAHDLLRQRTPRRRRSAATVRIPLPCCKPITAIGRRAWDVSWSPDTKLVVRAGFGIFYNQDIGNAYFDMARNIAGRVTQTSGQNGGTVGVPDLFYSNAVPGGSGAIAQIPPPYAYNFNWG